MESDSVRNHTGDYEIAGVRFVNLEYDYRPTSDDTKSRYQLFINITISEENCEFSSNVWLTQPTVRLRASVRLMINRGLIYQSDSRKL